MTEAPPRPAGSEAIRIGRLALVAGAATLAACALGGFANPAQFFHSYLLGYVFWIGISLGCLVFVMVHHLSGGAWGLVIRRLLEAGAATLPLMAVLFLPLVAGIPHLYEWSHPDAVAADRALQHKSLYLNVPFFLGRAALYFAAWNLLAFLLIRWSREQDRVAPAGDDRRFRVLSAPGLIVYGLTVTFASVDWIMSLNPHWFSTIFGVLIMGGQGLSALAFVIAVLVLLADRAPFEGVVDASHFHDLGKLLLAFVMLWAYFSFSQFLIIWSGNLPDEIPYYLLRLAGGWQWIALLLLLAHFALPFLLLLSRDLKRNRGALAGVAVAVVAMRLIDLFWLIGPELYGAGLRFHWMDLAAPIGLGGLWLALFVRQLSNRPLLPVNDPYFREAFANGRQ